MHFTVAVPNTPNAMGVDAASELFPTAHTEVVSSGVLVSYDQPNCEDWELPTVAAQALLKAWPDQVDAIMRDIRPCIGGFYGFNRWGMFVGVEPDGYIHS